MGRVSAIGGAPETQGNGTMTLADFGVRVDLRGPNV